MGVLKFAGMIIIFIIVFCISIYIFSRIEAKAWNKGYCPKCGNKLRHFDDDTQGGHGWCCDKCGYTTWVSYHNLVYRTAKDKKDE